MTQHKVELLEIAEAMQEAAAEAALGTGILADIMAMIEHGALTRKTHQILDKEAVCLYNALVYNKLHQTERTASR